MAATGFDVAVTVRVGEGDGEGEDDGVSEGDGIGDRDCVGEGSGVTKADRVDDGVGNAVPLAAALRDKSRLPKGVAADVGAADCEGSASTVALVNPPALLAVAPTPGD